jgi:hypothetical protein
VDPPTGQIAAIVVVAAVAVGIAVAIIIIIVRIPPVIGIGRSKT